MGPFIAGLFVGSFLGVLGMAPMNMARSSQDDDPALKEGEACP